jgi:hypothetical protein
MKHEASGFKAEADQGGVEKSNSLPDPPKPPGRFNRVEIVLLSAAYPPEAQFAADRRTRTKVDRRDETLGFIRS